MKRQNTFSSTTSLPKKSKFASMKSIIDLDSINETNQLEANISPDELPQNIRKRHTRTQSYVNDFNKPQNPIYQSHPIENSLRKGTSNINCSLTEKEFCSPDSKNFVTKLQSGEDEEEEKSIDP